MPRIKKDSHWKSRDIYSWNLSIIEMLSTTSNDAVIFVSYIVYSVHNEVELIGLNNQKWNMIWYANFNCIIILSYETKLDTEILPRIKQELVI